MRMKNFIFIIGSPRSGTTMLLDYFERNKNVSTFYEPEYIWGKYFNSTYSDDFDNQKLTDKIAHKIRMDYYKYLNYSKKNILIEKNPLNGLNIEKIHLIFPDAKFIYLIRDGRDTIASINREFKKRIRIQKKFNFFMFMKVLYKSFKKNKFWKFRFKRLLFELNQRNFKNIFLLNKSKWTEINGWGIRYNNWEIDYKKNSLIEFNAIQWLKIIEKIDAYWDNISFNSKIKVKYEDILTNRENTLEKLNNFLSLTSDDVDFKFKENNFDNWKTYFTKEECIKINKIIRYQN